MIMNFLNAQDSGKNILFVHFFFFFLVVCTSHFSYIFGTLQSKSAHEFSSRGVWFVGEM